MRIKSYNLFLESKDFKLSEENDKHIRDTVINLLDCEIIDGIEITECEHDDVDIYTAFNPIIDNTWRISKRVDSLDNDGKNIFNSKYVKYYWDDETKSKCEEKYFNNYEQTIINIRFKSDKIILYLDSLYNILINDGFLVNAWRPGENTWRFHISTQESNPFIISKNILNSVF